MEMEGLLCYEVNMLTEENVMSRDAMIKAIRVEFDFIKMCQPMIRPFGYEAREVLYPLRILMNYAYHEMKAAI